MSDEKAIDLVLRARNEVSKDAESAAGSLDHLAQGAQQLDAELKQLESAGAVGKDFDDLKAAVSGLNQELAGAQAAQKTIDSFIKVKAETEKTRQAFIDASSEVERLKSEMEQVEKPTTAMEKAMARAEKAAASTGQKLDEKRATLRGLSASLKEYGANTQNLTDSQDALTKRTDELGTSFKKARADIAANSAAARQAKSEFSSLQTQLKPLASAMAGLFAISKIKGYATDGNRWRKGSTRNHPGFQQHS